MPEPESADETLGLSRSLTDSLGIDSVLEDISPILEAAGLLSTARRRDPHAWCPEYGPDYKSKIVLPSVVDSDSLRLYSVVVQAPDGTQSTHRLTADAYLEIVAATNFKQRTRKMLEYFHADRLNYVVRRDARTGWSTTRGSSSSSATARPTSSRSPTSTRRRSMRSPPTSGCPQEIQDRPSTTDTYSLPQSQEEFYFSLPYPRMDLCVYALNHDVPIEEVAEATGLTVEQVTRVYRDIEQKRRTTAYLHAPPVLAAPVAEVGSH